MLSLKQSRLSQTRTIIFREILTLVHGDVFVAVAEDDHVNFLERVLENSIEIKRVGRIGPGRSSAGKVLKRVVSWTGDGFTWEADPRLLGKLMKVLNRREGHWER